MVSHHVSATTITWFSTIICCSPVNATTIMRCVAIWLECHRYLMQSNANNSYTMNEACALPPGWYLWVSKFWRGQWWRIDASVMSFVDEGVDHYWPLWPLPPMWTLQGWPSTKIHPFIRDPMTQAPRTCTSASNRAHRGSSLHIYLPSRARLTRHRTISSLARLPNPRISSPRCQARCGEAEREYDNIVVGLFNSQSNCTLVLLDAPAHSYSNRSQVLSPLRAYLSTPQSLRISTGAHSVCSPLRLSPFCPPFPHMAMSGTFEKNFLDPDLVWDFKIVRMSGIQ